MPCEIFEGSCGILSPMSTNILNLFNQLLVPNRKKVFWRYPNSEGWRSKTADAPHSQRFDGSSCTLFHCSFIWSQKPHSVLLPNEHHTWLHPLKDGFQRTAAVNFNTSLMQLSAYHTTHLSVNGAVKLYPSLSNLFITTHRLSDPWASSMWNSLFYSWTVCNRWKWALSVRFFGGILNDHPTDCLRQYELTHSLRTMCTWPWTFGKK